MPVFDATDRQSFTLPLGSVLRYHPSPVQPRTTVSLAGALASSFDGSGEREIAGRLFETEPRSGQPVAADEAFGITQAKPIASTTTTVAMRARRAVVRRRGCERQ